MTFEPGPANPQPFSAGMHLQPQFDVIELLPPAAADKLRMLRQRSADTHAVIPEFADIQEATTAGIEAENRLNQLTNHPQEFGHNLPPTDARVVAQQRLVDKLTDDLKRLKERSDARAAAWQTTARTLGNAEDWLRNGRPSGVQLLDYDGPEPTLAKGEGILDGIERLRRRGRELKADLHRIASAPYPSAYAKAQMRAQIEQLAMQGAPSVSSLIEHDGKIAWPMQMMRSEVRGGEHPALAFAEIPDALALACWLHKDALVAALTREISTESGDAATLSPEARAQAEAEVLSDILRKRPRRKFLGVARSVAEPSGRTSQRLFTARDLAVSVGHDTARRSARNVARNVVDAEMTCLA